MAWIQMPTGWWQNTAAGDPTSPDAWMSDAQYRAQLAAREANPQGMDKYVQETGLAYKPYEESLGDSRTASSIRAPSQGTIQGGAAAAIQEILALQGPVQGASTLKQLAMSGYFNQFSDFTPELGEQIGQAVAKGQHLAGTGDIVGDAFKGTLQHVGNITENYGKNPEQLLTAGAFGPLGSSLESGLWGGDSSASDAMGRPSESTYADMDARGIDRTPNQFIHTVGPMVGAAAAGAGLANAAGMGSGASTANASAGPSSSAPGGISANAGPEFTGGLNPNVTGSPGFNPNIQGSPGVFANAPAGTSLAPGYFGAESMAGPLSFGPTSIAPGASTFNSAPALAPVASSASTLPGLLSSPQVIGGIGGALLGALSSNSGSKPAGTITTEEGIPDWLMPYVKPQLDRYSTEVQNYNVDPYGIMPSAMQQFQKTIDGGFLTPDSNPYLNDYFRLGAERIKGSLSPSFGHMQAFGQHSGYNEALARGLGDFGVQLYGGAYEKERDRQNQFTAAAPAFLGQSSQAQFQPYSQYLQTISGLGKSKEQPYFNNQFGSILGGALVGSQFGKAF